MLETGEKAIHDGVLLVVLVHQLQLIENALSLVEYLADSLVVGVHVGLDSNAVCVLIDDEAAGIKKVLSSNSEEIDRVLDLWDLALDMVVHASEKDPFLHVDIDTAFLVTQFRKFLVQNGLEASNLE